MTPPFRASDYVARWQPRERSSLGRDLSRLARVLVAALFNYPTRGRFHIRLLSVPTMPERIRRATTLIIIFFDGCASSSSLSPRLKMHINISEALKSGDYLTWKGAHRSCRWPFVSSLIPQQGYLLCAIRIIRWEWLRIANVYYYHIISLDLQ